MGFERIALESTRRGPALQLVFLMSEARRGAPSDGRRARRAVLERGRGSRGAGLAPRLAQRDATARDQLVEHAREVPRRRPIGASCCRRSVGGHRGRGAVLIPFEHRVQLGHLRLDGRAVLLKGKISPVAPRGPA